MRRRALDHLLELGTLGLELGQRAIRALLEENGSDRCRRPASCTHAPCARRRVAVKRRARRALALREAA